jgi:ribosomal protein S4
MSWEKKNLGYLILYTQFKHLPQRVKKKISTRFSRPPKNNQFNIKWGFNRFLHSYYLSKSLDQVFNIENRLDLMLFRTNWFINKSAIFNMLAKGMITVNNRIEKKGNRILKPGDIIQIHGDIVNYPGKNIKINQYKDIVDWEERKEDKLPQYPKWLELNHNSKSIFILTLPDFKDIPYPFNLNKFYV